MRQPRFDIKALQQDSQERRHFEVLPADCHAEIVARMAFLVTRGSLPDTAYHNASETMHADEAEAERDFRWDLVKRVADAWPDPARGPDGRPAPGVFELARQLEGLIDATIEIPALHEANRETIADMAHTARMRRKLVETFDAEVALRMPEPAAGPAAGDGAESDGMGYDSRFDDEDQPF